MTENTTFALLIEQLPEAKASALWNFAYDAGYGAGPAVFGLICVRTGYPAAFALTGALILAAVPLALRERKATASVLPSQGERVNDARRVADVVGDDVGYPAPRQALHGVVFPQADEAPLLSPPSASATFSYIWDLSRRVHVGNDQAEPCWIPIPSCKNPHARSRRLHSPADGPAPVPEMLHVDAVPTGPHGARVLRPSRPQVPGSWLERPHRLPAAGAWP